MPRKIGGILTEALLEILSDPVIAIDKDGRVHVFNEAAATVFGASVDQVLGRPIWDCLPMHEFCKALIAMIKESRASFREGTYTFPSGRIFVGQLTPVRLDDGRLSGACATLKDVTPLQNIEQHVSDFVGSVSNQFRLPLTSIKGFVETLLEGAMADPAVTRKFLQVINDESNRMVRLLMSLTEATGPPPSLPPPQPVPLPEVVAKVVSTMRTTAEQKRVRLLVESEVDLVVLADAGKLDQVLTNLIDNAIKYTAIRRGGGGQVVLSARLVADGVELGVEDNGVGIPPDEADRVFERYYRVQNGPAAQLGGTGLGLSISRDILRHYGAVLAVKSTVGEGSLFSFVLPVPQP